MRLGVDAFNLAADRRGMGRHVRTVLRGLDRIGGVEPVFIVRKPADAQALQGEFRYSSITPGALRGARLDCVWYPWNGIRFKPHAPAIVTIHDLFAFTHAHPNFVARLREQAPIRRAIRTADRIIAVSQWTASELRRVFRVSEERIDVATPVLESFWHPSVSTPGNYVLFVAGPDARKNAALLFAAFDDAFAQDSVELVVAGTLNDADEKMLAAMRAPHRRVAPDDAALRDLYSGALAVAVPSRAEGFGLAVIEAMACGAPVIAADTTALPEACEGAALEVPPNDRRAWSEALRKIASNESLRRALREKGLARVSRIDRDGAAKSLLASVQRLRASVR